MSCNIAVKWCVVVFECGLTPGCCLELSSAARNWNGTVTSPTSEAKFRAIRRPEDLGKKTTNFLLSLFFY